jgi:hypothetical protein
MRLLLHSNFLSTFIRLTKNILTLQADEDLLSELEVDVREECTKFGPVDNVKVRLATNILLFLNMSRKQILPNALQNKLSIFQCNVRWIFCKGRFSEAKLAWIRHNSPNSTKLLLINSCVCASGL